MLNGKWDEAGPEASGHSGADTSTGHFLSSCNDSALFAVLLV